jgi:hypothetical protein
MSLRLLLVVGAACLVQLAQAGPLPLQEVKSLPALSVPVGQSGDVSLPALPAQAGKLTVLSFRVVTVSPGPGGCNWNLAMLVNGQTPGRFTSARTERLLSRAPSLTLIRENLGFSIFSGDKLMVMYAKDAAQGDGMTADGLGATFDFDVTDLVRGVDGNTVTFRNTFPGQMPTGQGQLAVTDLQVGYLDRTKLPKIPSMAPQRTAFSGGVTVGKLRLAQGKGGGFVVQGGNGPELLVETAVAMKSTAASDLRADDASPTGAAQLQTQKSANGYGLTATWQGLTLKRTLTLQGGLVQWHEQWTNTGSQPRGVPFQHRLFLRDQSTHFWLGGSPENCSLMCSTANPTMFLAPAGQGNGFGITAESDWLKLLAGWRGMSDLGEIYSNCLALDPRQSLSFDLTIAPVMDGGGYWSFLNGLRRRYDVNQTTMPAPMFWGFERAPGATPEESLRRSLGHLGPIIACLGPWQRLEPDSRVVTARQYPKLPAGAAPAPGACPDLDVDAFLTFKHREPYWQELQKLTALIHSTCPQAKVIEMLHPAMEAVYKPLQDRWPIAPDAIKTAAGATFEESVYDRAWLGDMMKRDWGVLYYCPHEGGPYLRAILQSMMRGMDECRLDGLYSDEFGFAFSSRYYSRYDYSRNDGYSADLDDNGNILRRKADNGWLSQSAQLAMAGAVLQRDKFFLGNWGNVLNSLRHFPMHHFIEGGNGPAQWGQGHLSAVPLVLGNMGNEKTLQGVFDSVRWCLSDGCVYSPMSVNLLLSGSDNFVCKQYPLTVRELGPGFVIGRERIITTVSRAFDWPPAGGRLKFYCYDSQGTLQQPVGEGRALPGKPLAVTVPPGGLVIVERQPQA